jgi:hypothetical protein
MNTMKKKDGPIEVVDLKQGKLTWAGNKYVAGGLLVVAVALFIAGTQISWTVWDEKRFKLVKQGSTLPFGSEQIISDFKLVEDATFSGVESIDGILYSTYDRTKKLGKKACPT